MKGNQGFKNIRCVKEENQKVFIDGEDIKIRFNNYSTAKLNKKFIGKN